MLPEGGAGNLSQESGRRFCKVGFLESSKKHLKLWKFIQHRIIGTLKTKSLYSKSS